MAAANVVWYFVVTGLWNAGETRGNMPVSKGKSFGLSFDLGYGSVVSFRLIRAVSDAVPQPIKYEGFAGA
jgi:hypothetical protein